MRANTVMPLALISVSRRSTVSFAPKWLGMVFSPSAAMASSSDKNVATVIATDPIAPALLLPVVDPV
jgi:hypothetical protein